MENRVYPAHKVRNRTSFFLLISIFCLLSSGFSPLHAASIYAQEKTFTVRFDRKTVKEVFDYIEKNSEFVIVYTQNLLPVLQKRVSLQVQEKPVDAILKEISRATGIKYSITDRQIAVWVGGNAPPELGSPSPQNGEKTVVKGQVVDEKGEPVIGANVKEKDTANGVITDLDGVFSLSLPVGSTLQVSYIGYVPQEVKVDKKGEYHITLREDSEALDEVVVIGYGTVKKSDLTGSVASVKSDELSAMPQASAAQALQGRSAGVFVWQNGGSPESAPTVRIRGSNSILGNNDPLYVIDGFPSNSGIGMLNVDDIESMEILKDASAIAIYGSRGSNGVILVTTKKGADGKTRVDFGTTMGIQKVEKKMEMMDGSEYAEFYNIRAKNDGQAEPFFTPQEVAAFGKGFDWQDFIFTTAPLRTHSLSVSGGNNKTRFSISGNIFDQKGIVGKGSYDRYTLRANIDHNISRKVSVSFNATLSRAITDNKTSSGGRQGGSLMSVALVGPPLLTPYNEDGSYSVLDNSYPFITTGGALINPLNILNEQSDITKRNRVLSNVSFTYEPIDGLFIKISGGVENNDSRNDWYRTTKYWKSTGSASVSTSQEISLLNENTISYIKTFAQKHNISAVAGFTYQDYKQTTLGGSGQGFLSDITSTGSLGSAATPGIPSSGYQKWVLLSTLARVNYNYDHRYFVTFSFRADGSSRYSEGDKWGYFPSAALAWRMSEEKFMKSMSWLSDLKLRASYGVSGSQAISPYSTMNNLVTGKTVFGNERYTIFGPGRTLPGRLKWESTAQMDFGIDFAVLKNRLRFTIDYYDKETRDLLNNIPLPTSSGYDKTLGNVGKIQNKGFEFAVNAHLINTEFQWAVDANLSVNKSKVKKLYGGKDILGSWLDFMVISDNCTLLREGEPMNIFYGYIRDGYDENGQEIYKDLTGDGIISQDDRTKIGDPNPKFIYGLTSNMQYKGIELSLFFQGSQGNDILNASAVDNTLYYAYGLNQRKEVFYDHWTPDNPDAKYPKPITGMSMRYSDRLIENGSYLRLKNVELAYNFPVKSWRQDWLQRLRLSFSMQNLFTITKYSGWNPALGSGTGIDHNPYPLSRTYTFGINVTF